MRRVSHNEEEEVSCLAVVELNAGANRRVHNLTRHFAFYEQVPAGKERLAVQTILAYVILNLSQERLTLTA